MKSPPQTPDPTPETLSRVLLVVAAPAEARAVTAGIRPDSPWAEPTKPGWTPTVLSPKIDLLLTGIGKANAAAAIALAVSRHPYRAVINLGICGLLPSPPLSSSFAALPLCTFAPFSPSVILATHSIYADEGLQTPDAFLDTAALGFPLGPPPIAGSSIPADPALLARLHPLADLAGPIATVSTCSGTDALAAAVALRTQALAEAMEGAAIAHILARLSPSTPFAELRVVSNTTGDRPRQLWNIRAAFDRLERLAADVAAL